MRGKVGVLVQHLASKGPSKLESCHNKCKSAIKPLQAVPWAFENENFLPNLPSKGENFIHGSK
jgi:hypothetical protein